jgi:L-threonylcarbamoyladenylate synthase
MQKLLVDESRAVSLILDGSVGVMPTDTVYGLVAQAADREATARLYALKHRERKPGTIIAANIEQLVELGIDKRYLDRISHLWPNPLSVVVPAGDELYYLHQGLDSIPMRIPDNDEFKKILLKTGALISSSANQPHMVPAANAAGAWEYFQNGVDFYVDGGNLSGKAPSTIIRISENGHIEVLREGAFKISADELKQL